MVTEVISSKGESGEIIPYVGAIVTGWVNRLTSKLCEVQILCVGEGKRSSGNIQRYVKKRKHSSVWSRSDRYIWLLSIRRYYSCFRCGVRRSKKLRVINFREFSRSYSRNLFRIRRTYGTCELDDYEMPRNWNHREKKGSQNPFWIYLRFFVCKILILDNQEVSLV